MPREILGRIGEKWSVLAILTLQVGPHGFNELRRAMAGVSQRMLTLTLRGLERDGFVVRTSRPTVPPRVDYALTPLGASLSAPVLALGAWAQAHEAEVRRARTAFDGRAAG